MSHLHPEHTNGIRALDDSNGFPNAEIMVPAREECVLGDIVAARCLMPRVRRCVEHGVKADALNDHSLSLAATAPSLAESALLLSSSVQARMYKAGDGRRATIVWFDFGKGECHAERSKKCRKPRS